MTTDPRWAKLVAEVQEHVPAWEPPAPPEGDASALLDQLKVGRLRDVLMLAPSWPDQVRDQVTAAIEGVITAIETGGGRGEARQAAADARQAADAAWSAVDAAGAAADAAGAAAWSAGDAAESAVWAASDASDASEASAAFAVWAASDAAAVSASAALPAARLAAWQREADRITKALATTGEQS